MNRRVLRVAWFWSRTNLARRRASYLGIVLLLAVLGGVAMASVSGARRTDSSYNTFLTSTNPSDMTVTLYGPNFTTKLSHLPLVRQIGPASESINAFPAGRHGNPTQLSVQYSGVVASIGLMHGEYESIDKVTLISGHLENPNVKNQFVMTPDAANAMGWHLGQVIPMYFYTNKQTSLPAFGSSKVKPDVSLIMHLVGIVEQNDEQVSDESERYPALMFFTPVLARQLADNQQGYFVYGLQLTHGARDVPIVEREIISTLPPGTTYTFHVTSIYTGQVNRSIAPNAIALAVFGLIAELAALIIAGSLIAREIQRIDEDVRIMYALGASPRMIVGTSLLGPLSAVVVGSFLAVIVAVALSPLSPIGPVRAVYPHSGVAFDWSALGLGFALLVITLGLVALLVARRQLSRNVNRSRPLDLRKGSTVARRLAEAGMPVTAVVGVRFALGSGRSRDASPVRFALVGAVFAVMIVVTTLTFGSSLNTLISHPPLYGWNWNYALGGSTEVPPQAENLLKTDPYVSTWSGYDLANAQINGLTVPILLTKNHDAVSPPLLQGHEVDANNQIVLGAETLQQLHKRVGQFVTASYGTSKDAPVWVPPTKMLIVGSATLPAVGGAQTLHTSMGVGAIIPSGVEPPAFQKFLHSKIRALNGPQIVFIRFRPNAPPHAAAASLEKIAKYANHVLAAVPNDQAGGSVDVFAVQYPADIENYRSIGLIPAALALGLAAGAVVALGLTLVSSVRRRRRDLALLRTLGFSRRQLMATIAWQASVAGVTGVVIGVPLGVVLGRWLWTLFARNIYAVPQPTVSVVSIIVVALSALVLANVVAAVPGRIAAKTSTAQVLRDV
ncbi:MAG: FtsX-like permease family protein [Acidimicrobiales bacterium]